MKSWRSPLIEFSIFFTLVLSTAWLPSAYAAADGIDKDGSIVNECCDIERDDDVWIISTHHLGCPALDKTDDFDLYVEHYGGKGIGWSDSSLDAFFAGSDPSQPTLVYVHGNRVSRDDAVARAWYATNSILGCSAVGRIRVVIWSWPSEKMHGQIKDVRIKAARTNGEAYYLAWFLSQLDPATPLSMLGHSFGARVTTGALHLLGGGELAGRSLPHVQGPVARVTLLAAAVHNYWLQPGACHEYALSRMERLLIQYNSCDSVLKRYRFIEKHARPAALGYTGMYVDDAQGVWIDQRDVCCIVGKSHAESDYMRSTTLTDQIRNTLFE